MNRRRLWTHRLLLEAVLHEFKCVATLTYSDEHLPQGGTLVPRHMQLFLKRLRRVLTTARPIRFAGGGEYGDETWRPHYHLALYGVSQLESALVESAWGMGMVHLMELNPETAQYITGYVVKKMTSKDDPRLHGLHPEFFRMSRQNGGIGAGAVPAIAEALNDTHGAAHLARTGDVPAALMHGRRQLPLGRYLRRKLREELGFDEIGGQPRVAQLQALELRLMSEAAGGIAPVLAERQKKTAVKIQQLEGRAAIFKKRATL